MKRFIKYGVVPIITFLFLLIATIIVLPIVINVQKYIPEIEEKLSDVTGRPFSIGSNLGLSFFPWLSISVSDLQIGNPKGYLSDGFIKVESFEARVKLMPLLKKEVELSRFIIGGLELNLEKKDNGEVNWDFKRENGDSPSDGAETLFPDGLFISLFAVTDGTVNWLDRTQDSRRRIDDLMLVLNNVSLNNPIAAEVKGSMEGISLVAEGMLGPFGKNPGQGVLPVDLAVTLNKILSAQVKGKVINLLGDISYDINLHVPSFAARELFASVDMALPVVTADPGAFSSVEVDLSAKGDKEKVSVENGRIKIDDTLIDFFFGVNNISQPDLKFSMDIDRFDLDRYLPPGTENDSRPDSVPVSKNGVKSPSTWRKINIAGDIKVQELKVGGGVVNDINVNLHVTDGIFAAESSSFILYQGRAESTFTVDFQSTIPQTSIDLNAEGVQVMPLLDDFLDTKFMSGTLDADVRLLFSGNSTEAIKKNLYADGTLVVKDGALEGIDMVNAIRNIAALPSDSDNSYNRISTDFSEMTSEFTIRNGLVASSETTLDSSNGGVLISGTVDLVSEKLELAVDPKIPVAMGEEQGNEQNLSEGNVPFALSGTFARPKIDIEAKYLALDELNLSDESDMQVLVDEKLPSPEDEDVKDLVGTTLIDAAVVASRFGLEPKLISKDREKKQFPLGTGRIQRSPLQEKDSMR
jgi:AsmA protein